MMETIALLRHTLNKVLFSVFLFFFLSMFYIQHIYHESTVSKLHMLFNSMTGEANYCGMVWNKRFRVTGKRSL